MSPRLFQRLVNFFHVPFNLTFRKVRPLFIVVGSEGEGDPPECHQARRVMDECVFEAFYCFFMVETVCPGETAIEPCLRNGTGSIDRAREGTEIVV